MYINSEFCKYLVAPEEDGPRYSFRGRASFLVKKVLVAPPLMRKGLVSPSIRWPCFPLLGKGLASLVKTGLVAPDEGRPYCHIISRASSRVEVISLENA